MYDRTVQDQELTLVVSGMLWQRSLVMQDLETESLWSHLLGKSMSGALDGADLKTIPSLLTDWGTWKKTHPETSVTLLSRTAYQFNRSLYGNLRRFVVGMKDSSKAKAWGLHELSRQPIVNDEFSGTPLVIWFNRESVTPFFFDRRNGDRNLTFVRRDGGIFDEQTQSTWDLESGVAIEGELIGQRLQPLSSITSFVKAWNDFYPQSEFWERE